MSNYAIVNLLEIDDDVKGRVDGLEGRFGRKALGARDIGVSHWRYAPNLRTPGGGHSHREQEEAYVVVSGSGRIRLDDEIRDSASGTSSASPPRSSAPSRPAPAGSRSSLWVGRSPRVAMGRSRSRPGPTRVDTWLLAGAGGVGR